MDIVGARSEIVFFNFNFSFIFACFGRFARFGGFVSLVSLVSLVSFRSFRWFRFGRFVSLFRVLVHADNLRPCDFHPPKLCLYVGNKGGKHS